MISQDDWGPTHAHAHTLEILGYILVDTTCYPLFFDE